MLKKRFLLCLAGLSLVAGACQQATTQETPSEPVATLQAADILALYQSYADAFPAAALQDFYKYCFQDRFGPAHLITDSARCVAYIERETAEADSLGGPRYEPLRFCNGYVRVNLSAVADGLLDAPTLANAVRQSATQPDAAQLAAWPAQWDSVMVQLHELSTLPTHFADDSTAIANLLAEGKYVYHHSRTFNETYHYHYRLVRRDIFDAELLPRLEK
ncbi:MAG: hypothetical protein IJ684_02030 [Bacteroidales bacterium]|nr:hypothetical protein [Bacteroidales bacterium]